MPVSLRGRSFRGNHAAAYDPIFNLMQVYPKHYCGVFGVFGHPNAALQHRGQESAGIVSCDGSQFYDHKRMGLVSQIFNAKVLSELPGHMAVGHTRYSTTGSSHLRNAQPLVGESKRGQIAVAHNGNLTNATALREELEERGAIFTTTVDSEIVLHLLSQPAGDSSENSLLQTVRRLEGAYSLAIMTERELIGIRDPYGFRPLCLGRLGEGWVLASESCALDLISAKFEREIEPGEIVIIDKNGPRALQAFPAHVDRAFCIFEYVYFARPDSNIANRNVYKVRVQMGRELAREHPCRPIWWCRCRTAAIARRWAIRWNRVFPTRWRSCATITWGAVFYNLLN
jgi:amidophosphoribosyltransferase